MHFALGDRSAGTAPATTLPQSVHLPQNIHVELTHQPLDPAKSISHIRHPSAGANVLFLGTTRDTFEGKHVVRLSYSAYIPMAMRSMIDIAKKAMEKWGDVKGISIVHRLGDVPVGEESIVVGVSSGHREAGWRAGEEVLEEIKKRVEIWKEEVFK
ncbi:Molybdopterin synthase catalytic subunit, partial [Ascosphaera pollenicola]